MSAIEWIWIIIGIIVVLIIVGVLVAVGRRRGRLRAEQQRSADREQAATLRTNAKETELNARESQVAAARTAADADQAEIEAERLRMQAEEQHLFAGDQGTEAAGARRRADAIDPDVDETATGPDLPTGAPHIGGGNEPDDGRSGDSLAGPHDGDGRKRGTSADRLPGQDDDHA